VIARLLGMVLFIAAGSSAWAGAKTPLPVFVSILPQKNFVQQVGGNRVRASVMVPPGASPGTYQPSARQLSALSRARIYFRIGVPFEDAWMSRMESVNPGMTVVDTRTGIHLRSMAGDGPAGEGAGGRKDPHIWMDPRLVEIQVRTIRDALIQADPEGRDVYRHNAAAFIHRLQVLDRSIRQELASLHNRNIMTFHPAFGYFAAAYDLHQIPIEAGGKEPGARRMTDIIQTGRRLGVKVLLVEPQFSRRTATVVARAVGARLVTANPLAEDYVRNLSSLARAIAEADAP